MTDSEFFALVCLMLFASVTCREIASGQEDHRVHEPSASADQRNQKVGDKGSLTAVAVNDEAGKIRLPFGTGLGHKSRVSGNNTNEYYKQWKKKFEELFG